MAGALGLAAAGIVVWQLSAAPTDFAQDYFAARALLAGESVYGDAVTELGRVHFGLPTPANFHPPLVAVLFAPLSLLPYRAAFVVFGLASGALFLALMVAVARVAAPALGDARAAVACLLWWPLWACLTHGQVSLWVAAALAACWLADERGRPAAAGALAALATLLKLFPGLLALYFVLRRDRRALAAMALALAAGLALSAAVVGGDDFGRWVSDEVWAATAGFVSHPLNVSLAGAVQTLLGEPAWGVAPVVAAPRAARLLTLAGIVLVLAATIASARRLLRLGGSGRRRLFSALVVAALLVSPLTWSHTLAAAALPLLVAGASPGRAQPVAVLATAYLLIGFPAPPVGQLVVRLFAGHPIPAGLAALFQLPALGLLVLWWRLLRAAAHSRSDV